VAEPLRPRDGWAVHADREAGRLPRDGRARRALGGWARAALAWATRPLRLLPGLAAVGCAVAGTWLLWGLGWGLLVAAAFLLALDLRIPRA
jgi:hypothetical protein